MTQRLPPQPLDPKRLEDVIGVALACTKATTKKAFGDRDSFKAQAANRELSAAVTKAVLTYLHAREHPSPWNSTPPYRYQGDDR